MNKRLSLVMMLMAAGITLFSCQQKNDSDAAIAKIFQQARNNHQTSRDSIGYFLDQCQKYDTLQLSNLSKARILYLKGLWDELRLQYDSASATFMRGATLLPDNSFKAATILRAASDEAWASDYDSYRTLLTRAQKLLKKRKDPVNEAAFWSVQGDYEIEINDYRKAIVDYTTADSILKSNHIVRSRDYYQYRISYAYRRSGKYSPAFKHMLKSIEISNQLGNRFRLTSSYIDISRMYRDAQRYGEATKWEEKHLSLARDIKDSSQIRAGLENMGIIYAEKKEWDTAESYFTRSLQMAYDIHDPVSIGTALVNMGNFFNRKGDVDRALSYYKKGYVYVKKHDNKPVSIMGIMFHLGDANLAKKNFSLSEKYLKKALDLADSLHLSGWSVTTNLRLNDLYRTTKDYKKYVLSLQHYINVKDKWEADKQNARFNKLSLQYEKKQQDATIALQTAELKNRRQLLIILGIALLLIISVVTAILINKKTKERAIRTIYRQQLLAHDQQKVISSLLKKTVPLAPERPENKMLTTLLHLLDEQHIYQNADLSLEMLAQELGTNVTYVSQLINREFNCNFKTLINRYRINYSKTEIKENPGNLAMKNIGLKAGFKSQSTFYAAFKNEVGMTPMQFSKVAQLENNPNENPKKSD
ncbi:helix-turn-helix domain-containing protein [Prolixibacter bellariivorans]|nr:helix-turn-helix domain-containing protein [Prolixibacter bellariivorans]